MQDEYIVINKTLLEKKIKELEKIKKDLFLERKRIFKEEKNNPYFNTLTKLNFQSYHTFFRELKIYEKILFQSTPLTPIVEDSFDAGSIAHANSQDSNHPTTFHEDKENYISQLKLDI